MGIADVPIKKVSDIIVIDAVAIFDKLTPAEKVLNHT